MTRKLRRANHLCVVPMLLYVTAALRHQRLKRLFGMNSQLKEKQKDRNLQTKHRLDLGSATIDLMASRVKIQVQMTEITNHGKQGRKALIPALLRVLIKMSRSLAKRRVVAAKCAMVMMQ